MEFGEPSSVIGNFATDPLVPQERLIPGSLDDDKKPSSWDLFDAADKAFQATDAINARMLASEAAIDERNQRIKEMLGVDLENPHHVKGLVSREQARRGVAGDAWSFYYQQLQELAKKHPEHKGIIQPDRSNIADAYLYTRQAQKRLQEVTEQYGDGWFKYVPLFAGGIYGMRRDPINLAASTLGFNNARIGVWGLLSVAAKNAGVNAGIELAQAPIVQDYRAAAGVDSGVDMVALNVLTAGAFGFGLDLGVRGAARGVRSARGQEAVTDDKGIIIGWKGKGEADPITISPELAERVSQGDPAATREVAKKLGIDEVPAVKGAIDAMESDQAVLNGAGLNKIESGAGLEALAERLRQAERAATDPAEPPPVHYADDIDVPPARGQSLADAAEVPSKTFEIDGKGVQFRDIDMKLAQIDAQLFQFKSGGDAVGATGRLSGVRKWDDMAVGKAVVFERTDGSMIIADGHQRANLARSLSDQETMAPAFVMREADGWTAVDVRTMAAKKNLQEGSASPIDAAKIIRERPDLIDGSIPLGTRKMQVARSLSRLSDDAFDQVVGGAEPSHGALVADLVPDKVQHASILAELTDMQPQTEREARLAVGELLRAGNHTESQMTLLGVHEQTRSLLRERVQVMDSALKELRDDARVFGILSREAERVEGAGNVLVDDVNQARAAEAQSVADLIERLAGQRGAVSDWLNGAAKAVAEGQPKARAGRVFADRIRKALDDGGLAGLMAESPRQKGMDDVAKDGATQIEDLEGRLLAIKAYHGSPHDFDQFDMGRIGTGQGGAWFGRGLNFSNIEQGAEHYLNALSPAKYDGQVVNTMGDDAVSRIAFEANAANVSFADAQSKIIANLEQARDANSRDAEWYQSTIDGIAAVDVAKFAREGALYEVRLDVEQSDLLDWEKPLSQQSDKVRAAVKNIAPNAPDDMIGNAYRGLVSTEQSTRRLVDAGVFGVVHDIGSANERNFVVFDDSRVATTKKNGKPVSSGERDEVMLAIGGSGMDRAPLMDELGFVSRAVEAARGLKQAKGTPEQMLSQLRKAGVKQAEIDATGLEDFLDGQKSVTRDGLVAFLELQRVPVREAVYGAPASRAELEQAALDDYDVPFDELTFADQEQLRDSLSHIDDGRKNAAKWSSYSLDPSNPTYRETVLHLPPNMDMAAGRVAFEAKYPGKSWDDLKKSDKEYFARSNASNEDFETGHFSEPNAISHLRTSIQPDAEGRQNFVINELQSDWGQKLRTDGGARDEAKIADLETQVEVLRRSLREVVGDQQITKIAGRYRKYGGEPLDGPALDLANQISLREAELSTALDSAPGNPIVNTTDQWVATSLRRALRQAVDADADYIAIASGETVYGFGMGAPLKGLKYAYNEMYPKKLRDILKKIDKDAAKPETVERLYAHGTTKQDLDAQSLTNPLAQKPFVRDVGNGFTRFPITQKIKDSVREQGQPLFAISQSVTKETVLYRGEPINADGGLGHHYTRSFDRAKGFAGEGGRVYAVSVPISRMGELKPSRDSYNYVVPEDLRASRIEVAKPLTGRSEPAMGDPLARGYSPFATIEMPKLRKEIDRIVSRLPEGYRIELEDRLVLKDAEADAFIDPYDRLIKVALSSNNPARYARHEEIHAYRNLKLFSDQEWSVLTTFSRENNLRSHYQVDERYAEFYGQRKPPPERLEEMLIEETIAEMWADRIGGQTFGPVIDSIIDRVVRLIDAISRALGGKGYLRVEDVFRRIESGEIGGRSPSTIDDIELRLSAGDKPTTPGLDMSQEARMSRAKAMGFDTDTVWYRGAINSDSGGMQWFAADRDTANWYARDFDWNALEKKPVADGANVVPVLMRDQDQFVVDAKNAAADAVPHNESLETLGLYKGLYLTDEIADAAKAAGYKSVRFNNIAEEAGSTTSTVAIFDPSNIRSVNAAFDPAHDGSPNLMFALRRGEDLPNMNNESMAIERMGHITEVVGACRR